MRKLLDLEHPFFRPVGVRVAVVVVCGGWSIFEFMNAAPLWGVIFLGLAVICAYRCLLYTSDAADDPTLV
mgnify:CR=1 FL=1